MNMLLRITKHIRCGSIGSILYGSIAISLYVISLACLVNELKNLIFSLEFELSIRIAEKLIKTNQTIHVIHSKYFVINQFLAPICLLTFSFLTMILFSILCFFNVTNLSNGDHRFGHDLIQVNLNAKKKSKKLTQEYNFNNFSLSASSASDEVMSTISACSSNISSSPARSTTSSSACSSSSSSTTSEFSTVSANYNHKPKFFFFLCLPPINTCLHFSMCILLLMCKLNLDRFQQSNDLFKENQNSNQLRLNATVLITQLMGFQFVFLSDMKDFIDYFKLIDINYFNLIFAYLTLMFRLVRAHYTLNKNYSLLLLLNLILFTLLNILTTNAFEAIFKGNSIKLSETIASNEELKHLIELSNSTSSTRDNSKFIPNVFKNDFILMISFKLSFMLNLMYFSSFNAFSLSFYVREYDKIKIKLETLLQEHDKRFNHSYLFSIKKKSQPNKKSNGDYSIESQYRIIIIGIVLLLATELLRIPIIYLIFFKYLFLNSKSFLFVLIVQLVYLMYNAIVWFVFSFKTSWSVHFSSNFLMLLWNQLSLKSANRLNSSNLTKITIHSDKSIIQPVTSVRSHTQRREKKKINSLDNLIRSKSVRSCLNFYMRNEQQINSKFQKKSDSFQHIAPFATFTSFKT